MAHGPPAWATGVDGRQPQSSPRRRPRAGNFTGAKRNEFVVARGQTLELLRNEGGRVYSVASQSTFGWIRAMVRFRLHGQDFDHVIVGSDAGTLTVLRFDSGKAEFVAAQCEVFGHTGCRRITPGQYVAADPRGRAVMIAALEKGKLVYLLNREETALTIGSPLEAHKSHTIVFDVVGVDVGLDNPIFAALEVDYGDADADPTGEAAAATPKLLVHYELDLGLNTVTRKWSRETDRGANALVQVPGGDDGPGGVLVLAENWVLYERPDQPTVRTPVPRRADLPPERQLLLTAATMHKLKPGHFFFLLQSEYGDLYKATLTWSVEGEGKRVSDLTVQYFDTVPPAISLCVTRTGGLFTASEFGDHMFYQFRSLGEDDATAARAAALKDLDVAPTDGEVEVELAMFAPRPLTNLRKVAEIPSLAPIVDAKMVVPQAALAAAAAAAAAAAGGAGAASADALALAAAAALGSGATAPFIAAACGRGPRSTLRLLREGLSVAEIAVSAMPPGASTVFTVPTSNVAADAAGAGGDAAAITTRYVLIAFKEATLVLSVGATVEEASSRETGISDAATTLAVQLLSNDSLLQVQPTCMRLIAGSSGAKRVSEWRAPGKRTITHAATNPRQVLLALSGGELIYFEMDEHGKLDERERKTLSSEVTALALGDVPRDRLRAAHAAVADAANAVRVLSLDPSAPLTQVAAQASKAPVESLAIAQLGSADAAADSRPQLFIGTSTGVLTRLTLDPMTGAITDPRSRFLGVRGIRLARVTVDGSTAMMAVSSRPWLVYHTLGTVHTSPLSYEALDSVAAFASPDVAEAVVAVAGSTMRIFTPLHLGERFNTHSLPLRHTPRRIALHPATPALAAVIETDHNALTIATRTGASEAPASGASGGAASSSGGGAGGGDDMDMDVDGDDMDVGSDDEGKGGKASAPAVPPLATDPTIPPSSLTTPGELESGDGTPVTDPQAEGLDPRRIGVPVAGNPDAWSSCIRLVDLTAVTAAEEGAVLSTHHAATHHLIDLPQDEAAVSLAWVPFSGREGDLYLLVGTVTGLSFHPRKHRGGAVRTYRLVEVEVAVDATGRELAPTDAGRAGTRRAKRLQFVHTTPVEDMPLAIAPCLGRVLVGVGRSLRLYDLGRRRLLRKCENNSFPTVIHSLHTSVDRIFVGDAADSVLFAKYRRSHNTITVFADDPIARHVTALLPLDHDTVAGGDKFGNVWVLRVPTEASDEVDAAGGAGIASDARALGGAHHKLEQVAQFFVGEPVTALQKGVLAGGTESLFYTTFGGAVGALMPLSSREDVDFLTGLQLDMRTQPHSVVGRDHLAFRSTYVPMKVSSRRRCKQGGGKEG